MAVKVGINGFGRIGRLVARGAGKCEAIELVAINDLVDSKTLAHLFKYDSTFGIYDGAVEAADGALKIDGKTIKVTAERDPAKLPWKELGVDVVVESTGLFRDIESAGKHLKAGAKKVILSAPGKGDMLTVCMGINENTYDPEKHHIISNASCTTNCLAPVVKVLHENCRIKSGLMTTIHSYTNDQVVLDQPHKDLRRGRAAAVSMIPSSTGAAKAIGLVVPELKGKLSGCAVRVPTQDVSLVDLTVVCEKTPSADEINALFKKAAASGPLAKYLEYCDVPLVSKDFTGNPASSIFDATQTVVTDDLIKVFSWYDNEWGYSMRVLDLIQHIAKSLKVAA
ncbi:MAG: type I glyceraldehyde-3-phosphate dehydrogenase [Elusimicrobiota bacterium]